MKLLKFTALSVLICLTLSSCGVIKNELGLSSRDGLTYNDQSISEDDLDADMKALASNEVLVEYLDDANEASGSTTKFVEDGKLSETYRAVWANIVLSFLAYKDERVSRDIEIKKEHRKEAQEQATQFFVQNDPLKGEDIWEAFDDGFKERMIEGLAGRIALLDSAEKVTDEDINKFYEENKERIPACESGINVSHILVATLEEADSIRKQLLQGKDFAKLAEEHSQSPEGKSNGGEVGCFQGDQFPPELTAAVTNLEFGTISDPIQTDAGFHIIKTEQYTTPTADDLREEIVVQLEPEKQAPIEQKVNENMKKAKVKVLEKYGKIIERDGVKTIVPLSTDEEELTSTTSSVPAS